MKEIETSLVIRLIFHDLHSFVETVLDRSRPLQLKVCSKASYRGARHLGIPKQCCPG